MKEKIFEAFTDLGFKLVKNDNYRYSFSYEGLKLLYTVSEDDNEFLSISVPCIYDCHQGNASHAAALTEKINFTLKYIKAYILAGSVWLFYERELITEEEDMMDVISRMINRLEAGYVFARKTIAEIESDATEGTGTEETDDGMTDDNDNNE